MAAPYGIQAFAPFGKPRQISSSVRVPVESAALYATDVCQSVFRNDGAIATSVPHNEADNQGFRKQWSVNPYAPSGPRIESRCRRTDEKATTAVGVCSVAVLENSSTIQRRDGSQQGVVYRGGESRDHYSLGCNQVQSNTEVQTDTIHGHSRSSADAQSGPTDSRNASAGKGYSVDYTYVRPGDSAMVPNVNSTFVQARSDSSLIQHGREGINKSSHHPTVSEAPRQVDGLSGVDASLCPKSGDVCEGAGHWDGYVSSVKHASITMCRKSSKVALRSDLAKEVHLPKVAEMHVNVVKQWMNDSTLKRFNELWRKSFSFEPKDMELANPMSCPVSDAMLAVKNGIAIPLDAKTPITCHAFSVLEDKLKDVDGDWRLVERRRRIDWAQKYNDEYLHDYKSAVDLRHHSAYFHRCLNDCGATFDLKASFYQVPLPNSRLFTFKDEMNNVYGLTRMPMGICTAPELMQLLTCTIAGDPLHAKPEFSAKTAVDVWIDNVLFSGSAEKVEAQEAIFKQRAALASATINANDSLGSNGRQTFIGINFDFKNKTIDWSSKTAHKIGALSFSPKMVLGELESAVSRLMYASSIKAVRIASYYWAFKLMRRLLSDVNAGRKKREDVVEVNCAALQHLRSWKADLLKCPARNLAKDSVGKRYTLYSDASNEGWGAVLIDEETQQVWVTGERWKGHYVQAHINVKEAAGLRLGIAAFKQLIGAIVDPLVDNTSALGAIEKGYSPSYELNQEILAIHHTVTNLNVKLRSPRYVKSSQNPADFWSRHFDGKTREWAPQLAKG